MLVGGRISDRAFPRYRRFRPLFRVVLSHLSRVGAQSDQTAERFAALGVPRERISVVGDPKLDRPAPAAPSAELLRAIGPGPLLLGASTYEEEERALLSAWRALRKQVPDLRLVLVPRHPERAPRAAALAREAEAEVALRSAGGAAADVVVVDTLGELASLYFLADLVFAGGTLANVGGHNLLEPVQAGKVVVHGPYTQNQRHQLELLEPLEVLHRVEGSHQLGAKLGALWKDPERNRPAQRAGDALRRQRGTVERVLPLILGEDDSRV